jgi:hypothetical protein
MFVSWMLTWSREFRYFYLNIMKGLDTLKIQMKFQTSLLGRILVQILLNYLEFF